MKKLINILVLLIVAFVMTVSLSIGDTSETMNKVADKVFYPSWKRETAKIAFVTSFCTYQTLNGLVESSKFSGRHIVKEDDYHLYVTAQSLSGLGAGWSTYALVQNKNIGWGTKLRWGLGAACIGRDFKEMAYRWNLTGDPVNYSEEYTSNKKAIIYWTWQNGWFVDAYVSGTGKNGAYIDAAFAATGLVLLGYDPAVDFLSWALRINKNKIND